MQRIDHPPLYYNNAWRPGNRYTYTTPRQQPPVRWHIPVGPNRASAAATYSRRAAPLRAQGTHGVMSVPLVPPEPPSATTHSSQAVPLRAQGTHGVTSVPLVPPEPPSATTHSSQAVPTYASVAASSAPRSQQRSFVNGHRQGPARATRARLSQGPRAGEGHAFGSALHQRSLRRPPQAGRRAAFAELQHTNPTGRRAGVPLPPPNAQPRRAPRHAGQKSSL